MTSATADDVEITEHYIKAAVNTIKEYFDKPQREEDRLFRLYVQMRIRAIVTEAEEASKLKAAIAGLDDYRKRNGK